MYCRVCKKSVTEAEKFCTGCGNNLQVPGEVLETLAVVEPATVTPNTTSMDTQNQNNEEAVTIEKSLLMLLFALTVILFCTWGYQSVRFLLASMFGVETPYSVIDGVVGLIGMIGSGLVFAGAALWWKENISALPFLTYGAILFGIKNIFDICNEIIIFANMNSVITLDMIDELALDIGNQLFQLAFWVFVYYYFKSKVNSKMSNLN